MSLLDELLDMTKAALDLATRIRKELDLNENQLDLRKAIVKELLSAMVHSHNLLINIEMGTDVFIPIQPRLEPPKIPNREADRDVHKLQLRLKGLMKDLETANKKESQDNLF